VLDLRFNGGGNINPMISGLAPLIGDGFIGGSVDAHDELSHVYRIDNGQFYDSGRLSCEMDNLPKIASSDKVVVLLSRYTISSVEMLAIAFKGRSNTHFIGEPSAGYTTGNGYDQVTDDLFMVISQSVFANRDKTIYKDKVSVDEEIEFQHQLELDGDKQMERALNWLNKK
jgi:carboxyl-terminal processing protease